ncbi:unnamed protein product [Paramecium sonneborni]|uniref:F5/8 type C domain-containing protein n=1 Tax=Paramecium sonneborni TaxID=65129 RepID=A0A8S1NAC3_9CILI|nr:unnamed protein product [Paramecium sonneborni]
MEHQNYCTTENGVRVCNVSSTLPNSAAENILIQERKALWMSLAGLPQYITLDLSQVQERPKFIKCFGFDCWHDYQSNPSVIELMVSLNGENFITWTTLYPELKQGIQLFQIDPLGTRYQFIKIIIKETFGASKTYLNQVYLLEEYAMISTESVTESQQQTENNNSQYKQQFEKEELDHHERSDRMDRFERMERNDNRNDNRNDRNDNRNERQDMKMNEYHDLAQKIHSMGREVASLKQSHQQGKSSQSQTKQGFHKSNITEDIPESFQRLTSTERMVLDIQSKNLSEINILKKDVQDWKDKCEQLESQVQRLFKLFTQIKDKQQEQEDSIHKYIQQNQSEVSFDANKRQGYNNNGQITQQQTQQSQQMTPTQQPQQQQQQTSKFEEVIDKKISELSGNFQTLFQQQESKFKNQQKEMIKSFKDYIQQEQQQEKYREYEKKKPLSRGRQKEKSVSKSSSNKSSHSSSSSSIINFIKSKKAQSKSRQQSKSHLKSVPRSRSPVDSKENDRYENNRLSPKQRKVATLLGKLQEKLQKRAKKIEQLNLSQRKTKKRGSIQNSMDQSNSSDY